jgi:hypothetical protein
MRLTRKSSMIICRAAWLLFIIIYALLGRWNVVIFHAPVFILSLPLVWLGIRDDHYWTLDALMCLLMFGSLFVTWTDSWPDYHSAFSYDKLFHAAGGAWLAGFWAVATRKSTKAWLFYSGIVIFALAIGGAWEVFEWVLSTLPAGYNTISTGLADSMLDMVADTVGAAAVAGVLWHRRYV